MYLNRTRMVLVTLLVLAAAALVGCNGDNPAEENGPSGPATEVIPGDPAGGSTPLPGQQPGGSPGILETPTRARLPTPSLAPSPTPKFLVRIVHSSVNVRTGPGTKYASIGFLYENDVAAVLGQNNDASWYIINFRDRKDVWIAASTVEKINR